MFLGVGGVGRLMLVWVVCLCNMVVVVMFFIVFFEVGGIV